MNEPATRRKPKKRPKGAKARGGKPPRTSGEHATARRPVQFPAAWDAVSAELAARANAPKVHFLIGLIAAAADRAGLDHPPTPVPA